MCLPVSCKQLLLSLLHTVLNDLHVVKGMLYSWTLCSALIKRTFCIWSITAIVRSLVPPSLMQLKLFTLTYSPSAISFPALS